MSEALPNVTYYMPKKRTRYVITVRFKGRRYTESAGTKLVNVQKRAKQLADQVDLVRSGLIPWEQLGLHIADRRQIGKHITAFCGELKADNRSPAHVEDRRHKLTRLADVASIDRLSHLTLEAARRGLAKLKAEGLSLQTLTHYVRTVKQFSKWATVRGKMPKDTLLELRGYNADTDRKHERRAESAENIARLLAVTESAGRHRPKDLAGADRAMLYRLAMATGLRARELRSLTHANFDLTAGTVTVAAVSSKRRKRDTVTLTADTVERLAKWLPTRPADAPVFKGMPLPPARMLKRDLKRAKIPYKTADGVFDFHALRGQLATDLIAANVNPKVTQEILRHADITTTMRHYARVHDQQKRTAMESVERMRESGRYSGTVRHELAPTDTIGDGGESGGKLAKSSTNKAEEAIPAARFERATSGLGNRCGNGRNDLRAISLSRGGKVKRAPSMARSLRKINAAARRMGVR